MPPDAAPASPDQPPHLVEPLSRRGASPLVLLLAAHPLPAFAVTVMATALAAALGRDPRGCALVAAAVLSGQLCIGWTNDLLDLRRDIAAGRRDKPLAVGTLSASGVAVTAAVAATACVPLSLASGVSAGAVHLVAVASGLAYNAVLKRTRWSFAPYALSFGLLPAFVTLGLPGHPWPPAWLLAAGALLGVGAHLTNVLPDIEADLACGVRGLPHRLGQARSRALAACLLLAASAVLILGPPGPPGAAGWSGLVTASLLAAAAASPWPARPASRLPFLLTIALAALDVALLLLRGGTPH
ncbi:4-hydroxybenzoate polyprenyltransferase [Streptacidiphilus sp. MAP12-33]|uniref:UbiA family prenyltransferase n=1 Tax=Streptacidiphilus sp. MAP12-33 TaxID=3156266 RepID=UPI003515FBD9